MRTSIHTIHRPHPGSPGENDRSTTHGSHKPCCLYVIQGQDDRSTIMAKKILFLSLIAACIFLTIQPVAAQTVNGQTVIYQTSFDSDPHWTTNNPSNDYWDPSAAQYHFSLEPSTGNYAYTVVNYDRGSFTLEYDVTINRIDDGATFRLGFSGSETDRTKGPNVQRSTNSPMSAVNRATRASACSTV